MLSDDFTVVTFSERFAAQSNLKIVGLEEFRPVEDDDRTMLNLIIDDDVIASGRLVYCWLTVQQRWK